MKNTEETSMPVKLRELFNLLAKPQWKNLNYSEKQLGYKRRYKGRVININGHPWLIYAANPHCCWVTDGRTKMKMSLEDARKCPRLN